MTLIQSISGIRGTMGGLPGEGLTPVDVVKFAGAYGMWLKSRFDSGRLTVVVGRDARTSGMMINKLLTAVLQGMGIHIVDAGLSTTPTVANGVKFLSAHGGVVITASHNPKQWNALKLLNDKGEFISSRQGEEIQGFLELSRMEFAGIDNLGSYRKDESLIETHIEKILALPLVNSDAIRAAKFTVVVDAVNSSGGIAVPMLLEALGVRKIHELYCEPNGLFPHNPEPLPEHLRELSSEVVARKAHLGIAVDPDVDRLAMVCEDGEMFGEEFTLVAVADYVLSKTPGSTVSNLSSTQALAEVTKKYGQNYFSSAVGEVHVVEAMKLHQAIIGGEGNGGIIYPELNYGRDALVGIALFLSHLAETKKSASFLRKKFPDYSMCKMKVELPEGVDSKLVLEKILSRYAKHHEVDLTDGVKILLDREWIHLRRSNTEPIIRIYTESDNMVKAENLGKKILMDIKEMLNHED